MDLIFLKNYADEDEGLGDAGIETFRDTPYVSTARECGQNSKDAGERQPIYLKFDLFEINASELPSRDKLIESIAACLDKAVTNDDEKESDFFQIGRERH